MDKNVPGTPEREIPEHAQLLAEFPSGFVLMVTCCTVNASTPGTSLYGHKANLDIDATRREGQPGAAARVWRRD